MSGTSDMPAAATKPLTEEAAGTPLLDALDAAVRSGLRRATRSPFVLGVCGAQGSGKSTVSEGLALRLRAAGVETAVLSIDDLYLTRAARETLAREVHPLFRVRGVPGTHDVPLGLATLEALDQGRPVTLPRFDKAVDDRAPEGAWPPIAAGCAVLILEGWCVGAKPQRSDALVEPVNALERDDDRDRTWRTYVNEKLGDAYQQLFERIDYLALLAAPDFDVVRTWRIQQEHELRARIGTDATGIMSDEEIGRFIQFYERLTRHILTEMPNRADLVVTLDRDRRPLHISARAGAQRIANDTRATRE